MGYTSKPCPGCGEDDGGLKFRKTGEVCSDCKHLLNQARRHRENQAKQTERQPYLIGYSGPTSYTGEPSTGFVGIIPHYNRGFYAYDHRATLGYSEQKELRASFWKLADVLVEPVELPLARKHQNLDGKKTVPNFIESKLKDSKVDGEWPVLVDPEIRNRMGRLYEAIYRALISAWEDGFRTGENLLGQLASGDITINDLNEAEIENTKGCEE